MIRMNEWVDIPSIMIKVCNLADLIHASLHFGDVFGSDYGHFLCIIAEWQTVNDLCNEVLWY